MPVFHVGDLVKPNTGHWSNDSEENPEAIGIILQMRDIMHMRPEAKILWNDVLGGAFWTFLNEIQHVNP